MTVVTNPNKSNRLLDINDAADMLHVHPETLRRWDRAGKLKAVRIGARGHRKYPLDKLELVMSGDVGIETQSVCDAVS